MIYREIAPTNLVCETIIADQVTTPLLKMGGSEVSIQVENGESIFHFNSRIRSQRVDVDALHLSGSPFDPSVFNTHELISETVDTVKIDGKLQIDDALLTYSASGLECDKILKAPDLILGSEKLSDHISMLAESTRLEKDTVINGELEIDGINCSNSSGRLLLDAVLETPGVAIGEIAYLAGNTVIGGGSGDVYSHKDSGPVMLTIGRQDSNDFQLCVRGKIVSDGVENSGYSSFTLFHYTELESGSPTGLSSRLFEWTGIPRLIHPVTGAAVNDWKTLHHAHSLSSVKLAESGNSQRIAGILHDIAAEKNDDEFNIHAPHGETRHKFHGTRELLRIASAGDHLCWTVMGGHEFSGVMLSGLWQHFENGVDKGQVLINVNEDMSFSIVDDEGLHNKINALEERLNLLLNA